jgi:hypothetical protein
MESEARIPKIEKAMRNLPKSVLKRFEQARPGAGAHPDADLLAAFAEQSLRGPERSFVMEHLAACSDCREVMVLALPEAGGETGRGAAPSAGVARGGWLVWPVLRWTALAAGILAVAAVGIFEYSHHQNSSIASNFMQRDAAPAPSNQLPAGNVTTPEDRQPEDKQTEPLSATRSPLLNAPAPKANGGAQPRGRAASSVGIGGGMAHRESAVTDPNLLAQNRPDLAVRDRNLGNSDVVKAKDPVAVKPASSSAAPAPPGITLRTSPALMLRVSPRWTISPAGALERSFDGGTTWETVSPDVSVGTPAGQNWDAGGAGPETPPKEAAPGFRPVFRALAASGLEVWAGTLAGALYHTSDGGNHWARVAPSEAGATLTGDIVAIQFSDPQQGKVSTSTGEVWTTFDGGQTWHKQP